VDLWGTERTCEKEIMVRASVRKPLNKIKLQMKLKMRRITSYRIELLEKRYTMNVKNITRRR